MLKDATGAFLADLKHLIFQTPLEGYSKIFLSAAVLKKGDVEFDVKNRNSSIAFLYMKSKCANFACVLLAQRTTHAL